MNEHRVLYALAAFTSARPMLPAMIETARQNIPMDIIFFDPEVSLSYSHTLEKGAKYFKDLGFTVLSEVPENRNYDVAYSTYPGYCYDKISKTNQIKYYVRFNYGVSGANVPINCSAQFIYNYYDFLLCLDEPDTGIFSGHAKSVNIGNIKLANYKRTRITPSGKKTLLYLPTWGSLEKSGRAVSITEVLVRKLAEMQKEYCVVVKMHPLTSHREDQREHFDILSTLGNVLYPDTPTDELFDQADVVLSDFTSGAFDAIAADVPLALFGLGEPKYYGGKLCLHQQLVKDDIIPGTNDVNELEMIIEKALSPEYFAKQQVLKKEMFPFEGRQCLDVFMKFQDDLFNDRVDPWYIASRRAIRENYIKEQNGIQSRYNGYEAQIREYELALQSEKAAYESSLQSTREAYENSKSWKLTKPLRSMSKFIRSL
jgi:CDP-glycerol glycerophosphotransferase (TagB/SpsB family)